MHGLDVDVGFFADHGIFEAFARRDEARDDGITVWRSVRLMA